MAIFNMSDSSINEYYLNEHGGAHRKIIDNIKKEQDVINDKYDKIDNAAISKEKKNELKSKIYNKERKLSDKSKQLLGYAADDYSQIAKYAHKHNDDGYDDRYAGAVQHAKNNIRNLAATNKPKNQEMHRIINKRSELKEAAEYILSVLDEMDYIEESEKKNR